MKTSRKDSAFSICALAQLAAKPFAVLARKMSALRVYRTKNRLLNYSKRRMNPRFNSNKGLWPSLWHITDANRILLLHSQDQLLDALHIRLCQSCFQPMTALLWYFFEYYSSIHSFYTAFSLWKNESFVKPFFHFRNFFTSCTCTTSIIFLKYIYILIVWNW